MRRRWSVMHWALGVALATPAVGAQSTGSPPFNQNIDMQSFRPAMGPNNFLTVEGSRVDGRLGLSLGAWVNYGYRPFTVFDANCPNSENDTGCTLGAVRSRPVEHIATLDLMATLTLGRRVQIGIGLPLVFASGDAVNPETARPIVDAGAQQTQTSFALGDPRVTVKFRLAGNGLHGFGLGATVFGTVPTGHLTGGDARFVSDDSVTVGGRLILDYRVGRFFSAVNGGVVWRPDALKVLSTTVGTRLQWGAAAGVQITPRLATIAEVFGSNDFSAVQQANALEGDLALRYGMGDVALTLGGGSGFIRGAGSPAARGFLGFLWAPQRTDEDNDGVYDNVDRCPTEPEDRDGIDDEDGCPDDDDDGDGIPDAQDRCPQQAEDRDGFQDADGCPDPDNDNDGVPDGYDSCPREPEDRDGDHDEDGCPDTDRDRDGVPDETDRCPTDPEDLDGFADADGCPEPDNDGDGIPDTNDQCSEQPETRNGFQDEDGCPDNVPDRDHDGIPDDRDRCPTEPETYNGEQDDDGCPEAHPALAGIAGGEIRIMEPVNFVVNSDRIVGAASFRVLDTVAAILGAHPEIRAVEIQGHTDNRGNPQANRQLSLRRANAVKSYLAGHGVAAARLSTFGYGPDRPLDDNHTAAGRARNRRVEFHIVEQPGAQAASPASPASPASSPALPR